MDKNINPSWAWFSIFTNYGHLWQLLTEPGILPTAEGKIKVTPCKVSPPTNDTASYFVTFVIRVHDMSMWIYFTYVTYKYQVLTLGNNVRMEINALLYDIIMDMIIQPTWQKLPKGNIGILIRQDERHHELWFCLTLRCAKRGNCFDHKFHLTTVGIEYEFCINSGYPDEFNEIQSAIMTEPKQWNYS